MVDPKDNGNELAYRARIERGFLAPYIDPPQAAREVAQSAALAIFLRDCEIVGLKRQLAELRRVERRNNPDARSAPTETSEPWHVAWRCAPWPKEHWSSWEEPSEAAAIQAGRKVYRMHHENEKLEIKLTRSPDAPESQPIGATFYHLDTARPESKCPEITRYWRVVYGPQQEAFVGRNVPVWRIVARTREAAWTPKTHAAWLNITTEEYEDALTYYLDHSAEIDAIVNARNA